MSKAPIDGRVTGELTHHVDTRRVGYNKLEVTYHRQRFQAVRPPDGRPPTESVVRCDTCGVKVAYQVFSVQATERRRRRSLVLALVGVLVIVGSVAGVVNAGGSPAVVVISIVGIVAGFVCALVGSFGRQGEFGLRLGPQTGMHNHSVVPHRLRTDEMALTCPNCGHAEPVEWGRYPEAKARLAAHTCPEPQ